MLIAIVFLFFACKKNINLSPDGCNIVNITNDTLYLSNSDDIPFWNGVTYILGNETWNYDHYVWNTGDSTSTIAISDTGDYFITAYNSSNQKVDSLYYTLHYFPGYILVPNTFTPNGDGINEYWYPILNNVCENTYTLAIYNEYNEEIFEAHNPNQKWDGTYKTGPAPIGQYSFQIEVMNIRGETLTKEGKIMLLR